MTASSTPPSQAPRERAATALLQSRDNFVHHAGVASVQIAHFNPRRAAPPLVSIVVPTYRRPRLLRQALCSAAAQKAFDDYEIVVVDNDPAGDAGTVRGLESALGGRCLRYFVNARNLGMTGNWNRGLQLARGEWVTFLHDDDWLSPDFLAEATKRLSPETTVVACDVSVGQRDYDPAALALPPGARVEARLLDLETYIDGNITPAPGLLARRALLVSIGGFDDDDYPCSDYVAYVRTALHGRALRLRRPLAYYRTTDSATYKGDTLIRMIRFSRAFKLALLASAPSLRNRLAYLQSMAYWLDAAARHGLPTKGEFTGALDRAAALLARSRTLRRALTVLRRTMFAPRVLP